MAVSIAAGRLAGSRTIELAAGALDATIVPSVGMVVASLRHHGTEVLGQRGGLVAYRDHGSSFGIPLLYPWANRLSGLGYAAANIDVELDPRTTPLRLDENGLPIHGLLSASPRWQTIDTGCSEQAAEVSATLDLAAHPELLRGFPFPHRITVTYRLDATSLRTSLTITPTGDVTVPIAFGFHPYLAPGGDRTTWRINLPVLTRATLDHRGLPTGSLETIQPGWRPLGTDAYDNLYRSLQSPQVFEVEAPDRTITVHFDEGYPCAQVFAPTASDFICFEPMTAPINALVTGDRLRSVAPNSRFTATFTISVRDH